MHLLEGKQIARRLRLTAGTLEHLKTTGKIHDYQGRYDFDEVQRVIVDMQRGTRTELEETETVTEDPRTHAIGVVERLTSVAIQREDSMFSRYLAGLERQQQDTRETMRLMQGENSALRKQIDEQHETICKLQQRYLETLSAHEEALSMAHDRKLREQAQAAADKRKDAGVEMLREALPHLVRSVQLTFEQKNLVSQLLGTFEPAQLAALMDPELGFLKPEQVDLLTKLIAKAKSPSAAAAATQNGASAPPKQEQPS